MDEGCNESRDDRTDRLKEEIECLRLTVGHAVNFDQSSDDEEETLHVDTGLSYADDHDEALHKPLQRYESIRATTAETIGLSQDPVAGFAGINVEQQLSNPEVCLVMNRAYQQMIGTCLANITTVLEINRRRQEEVEQELEKQPVSKSGSSKRKTLSVYSKPYFKDIGGSYPPPNEDTLSKRSRHILDPFVRPSKLWRADDRSRLCKAVQADRLKAALRPCMNKKELEHEKLKSVVPNSEEEKAIRARLDAIAAQIRAIQNETDIISVYGELNDVDVDAIDWMKIANVDFEGTRSAESCKLFWKNAAHPAINTTKWLPEEDKLLVELAMKYKGVSWKDVAEELGTNRTAFQCLQRYQTKLNPCLQTGKWTAEEDNFLQEVVLNFSQMTDDRNSIPWSKVAYYVEGRSREQCARRWEQLHPDTTKRGKWTKEEDEKLTEAVKRFGSNWWKVQEYVSTRSSAQCRERWKNTLDSSLNFNRWTYDEDRILWLLVQQCGEGKWQRIASEHLPGRTDNMCLQRYRRLKMWAFANNVNNPEIGSDTEMPAEFTEQHKFSEYQLRAQRTVAMKQLERQEYQRKLECALLSVGVNPESADNGEVTNGVAKMEIDDDFEGDDDDDDEEEADGLEVDQHDDEMLTTKSSAALEQMEGSTECTDREKVLEKMRQKYSRRPHLLKVHLEEFQKICNDIDAGIVIPRPWTNLLANRALLNQSQIVEKKETSEQMDAISSPGAPPPDDLTIGENQERKEECAPTPASVPRLFRGGCGRSKLPFEDIEVENSIAAVLRHRKAMKPKHQRRKTKPDRNQRTLSADETNAENESDHHNFLKARVMRAFTNALNFHNYYFLRQNLAGHPDNQAPEPGAVDVDAGKCAHVKRKSHSQTQETGQQSDTVQLDAGHVVSGAGTTLKEANFQRSCLTAAAEKCLSIRSKPAEHRQQVYHRMRLAFTGSFGQKIYTTAPIPPLNCTLCAFKGILLDRFRLLRNAGVHHVGSILGVPEVISQVLTKRHEGTRSSANWNRDSVRQSDSSCGEQAKPPKSNLDVEPDDINSPCISAMEADDELACQQEKGVATDEIIIGSGDDDRTKDKPVVRAYFQRRKRGRPAKRVAVVDNTVHTADADGQNGVTPVSAATGRICEEVTEVNERQICNSSVGNMVRDGPSLPFGKKPSAHDTTWKRSTGAANCAVALDTAIYDELAPARRRPGRPPKTSAGSLNDPFDPTKQVVKSKLQAETLLSMFRNTHDYQMFKARMLSLFEWPAMMSGLPISERVQGGQSSESAKKEAVVKIITSRQKPTPAVDVAAVAETIDSKPSDSQPHTESQQHNIRSKENAAISTKRRTRKRRVRVAEESGDDEQNSKPARLPRVSQGSKGQSSTGTRRQSTRLADRRLLDGEAQPSLNEQDPGGEQASVGAACAELMSSSDGGQPMDAASDDDPVVEIVERGVTVAASCEGNDSTATITAASHVKENVDEGSIPLPFERSRTSEAGECGVANPGCPPSAPLLNLPSSANGSPAIGQPAGVLMVPLFSTTSADGQSSQLTLGASDSPLFVVPPNALQSLFQQMPWLTSDMLANLCGGAIVGQPRVESSVTLSSPLTVDSGPQAATSNVIADTVSTNDRLGPVQTVEDTRQ